ncbi:hypothetical protein SAMN05216315_10625 [Nitrosospira sp. Nsp18]|uniref:hypothetical protein n=1 Tax=Nitrosospira sp. Nsp18 TaxID=1855334 RepID=UPI00088EC1A1|nr:hypothetical protein [Nitrosospira sp. Nsp18]SDA15372.1 hypothetical protein SAMN05216315_10625 [Nitrosospira sp. Nsp18]
MISKADTDQSTNSKCELENAAFIAGFKLKRGSFIRTPNEFLAGTLLMVITCLGMPAAMSTESVITGSLGPGGPPLTYHIDDVHIHLTRHLGNAAFPVQRVSLAGSGSATLERDGKIMPFTYQVKKLLVLMNEFYRIRFFDMPDDYTNRYSVFLKDEETVETAGLHMLDAGGMRICFTAASYEKCVNYGDEGPSELEDIARRIFSEADVLANK